MKDNDTFEVGKIYRYIGNGEWEIVDLIQLITDALKASTYGDKLP